MAPKKSKGIERANLNCQAYEEGEYVYFRRGVEAYQQGDPPLLPQGLIRPILLAEESRSFFARSWYDGYYTTRTDDRLAKILEKYERIRS